METAGERRPPWDAGQVARWLDRLGLALPTLVLIEVARPFSFFLEQGLYCLGLPEDVPVKEFLDGFESRLRG